MRWWYWLLICAPLIAPARAEDISARELQSIMTERERANNQRFDAQEKAVAAALAAAKEAVAKAEAAAEKRFEGLNEFRGTLKDQQATLMPRAEVSVLLKSMDDKFKAMEEKHRGTDERLAAIVARGEGINWLIGLIGALIGAASGMIVAFAALRRRGTIPDKPS
jgi:phosphopantetheinyl transferase (holo-ACP synthase)